MGGVAASADVFRAVADPTRRSMLELLRQADRSVHELAGPFQMTRPAVSQHLRVLREAGLVKARRVGREHVYRIHAAPLRQLYDWAAGFKAFVDPGGHVWSIRPRRGKP
jgi:DNA-binding transcriptional ArsR family regulator